MKRKTKPSSITAAMGGECSADSVSAFRAAQTDALWFAQPSDALGVESLDVPELLDDALHHRPIQRLPAQSPLDIANFYGHPETPSVPLAPRQMRIIASNASLSTAAVDMNDFASFVASTKYRAGHIRREAFDRAIPLFPVDFTLSSAAIDALRLRKHSPASCGALRSGDYMVDSGAAAQICSRQGGFSSIGPDRWEHQWDF